MASEADELRREFDETRDELDAMAEEIACAEAQMAAFARSGDPNDAALGTAWPNWPRVLLFDASATAKRISVQ